MVVVDSRDATATTVGCLTMIAHNLTRQQRRKRWQRSTEHDMIAHVFIVLRFGLYLAFEDLEQVTQQILVAQHLLTIELDRTNVQMDTLHLIGGLTDQHVVKLSIIGRYLGERCKIGRIEELLDTRRIIHRLVLQRRQAVVENGIRHM